MGLVGGQLGDGQAGMGLVVHQIGYRQQMWG